MREHKCYVCGTIYYSEKPGYWGYCSPVCSGFTTNASKRIAAERKDRSNRECAERDAAYAREFPNDATGSVRGRVPSGCRAGKFDDAQNALVRSTYNVAM